MRNPLEERQKKSHQNTVTNHSVNRRVRMLGMGKEKQFIYTSHLFSRPDGNGGYVDVEETCLGFDPAGNPMHPDMGRVVQSHSGIIFEPDGANHALCSSVSHKGANRHICLGQDGDNLPDGASYCDPCLRRLGRMRFAVTFIGASVAFGVLLGLFIVGWSF